MAINPHIYEVRTRERRPEFPAGCGGFPADPYQVNRLSDSLYSIREDISDGRFPILIYLVAGTRKAVLIDTGLGTGNLRKTAESITGLPIAVLHTHAHGDHVGADSQFGEIYLNERDFGPSGEGYDARALARQRGQFIRARLAGADGPERHGPAANHLAEIRETRCRKIGDGDIADLGGIRLRAVATPGHTPGSLSYVDEAHGCAFTGDGIADIHWFDGTVAVEDFLNTLRHFEANAKGVERIYAAHLPEPFGMDLVRDLQSAAEAILGGARDAVENADYQFLRHGKLYVHRSGAATIYYRRENVYHRPRRRG